MKLIDSHCHLDLLIKRLPDQLQQVLQQARENHLTTLIIPGLEPQQWPVIADLAESHDFYFAAGLHPWWIEKQWSGRQPPHFLEDLSEQIKLWIDHPRCVAIGECGLDSHISTPITQQSTILQLHIDLANEYQKPIILHSRKTDHHLLSLLTRTPIVKGGVVHGFSGHINTALALIKKGLSLGIGGTITYPRARKTRASVCQVPLSSLILETDAPDMPLQGFQGQPNTPGHIYKVAVCLSELRDEPLAKICETTTRNAMQLFQLDL